MIPKPAPSQAKSIYKKVEQTIKKNRESELFYKAFLTPIEIALKTHATESEPSKIGCMPYGLKQVFKTSLNENKFLLVDFSPIDELMGEERKSLVVKTKESMADRLRKQNNQKTLKDPEISEAVRKIQQDRCTMKDLNEAFNLISSDKQALKEQLERIQKIQRGEYEMEDVKRLRCDNLISLIKPSKDVQQLKVAICICMYSEDKSMLKRTLAGVSQNIETFVNNGYGYNQIGVFVIMDGIEVVDATVEQFFQELEKENNIYLGDDVEATNMEEVIEEQREVEDEEVDNFNHLIFSTEELQDRKMRRFAQRKKEYKTHKDMITNIEKMEKQKNLTYDSLDPITQKFFIEKSREQWKKDYAATDDDVKKVDEAMLLEMYAQNIKTSSPLIKQALNQAKKFCNEYISTRDNLALLNSFRVAVTIPQASKSQSAKERQNAYQQFSEDEPDERLAVKMNLFMVTKYKNRGKLSSHNWFFNGFCQELKPQFAVLLDVGLVPQRDALWRMCSHMEDNPSVGGVCGYMGLRIERLDENEEVKEDSIDCLTALSMKLVDIQRAQQFQYHFAHLIDKPFESSSCFKFIHVLPGAFSAYRMEALRPQGASDSKLLKQYFKSIEQASASMTYKAQPYTPWQTIWKVVLPDFLYNCFYGKPADWSYEKLLYDENVYLAEDRTLCMGIHQNKYDLAYLPDAYAWVDPMKTLYGLLGQRKRWINGSFFAFEKVKETLQGEAGDCCLKLQIAYLTFMNMLSFIAPALFMYTIHIAMYTFQTNVIVAAFQKLGLIENPTKNYVVGLFVYIIDLIYVLIFLSLVFYSMHLTNREPKFKAFFYGVSTLYGVFSWAVFGVLLYDIISGFASSKNQFLINNPSFVDSITGGQAMINSLRYVMLGIMGLYVVPVVISMIFCKCTYIIDILFSTFSFIFYSPTYLNILNIYALCRMDDISWGTKGLNADTGGRKKEMLDDWKKIKIIHVSKFVLYNLMVGFLLLLFGDQYVIRFWLTFSIMVLLGLTLGVKVFMGACYLISYRFCNNNKAAQLMSASQELPPKDPIERQFGKVRSSLYKGIENAILGIEKDVANTNISMPAAVLSSKINFKLRFNKESSSKNVNKSGKSSIHQWQNLSKIQNKKLSKALDRPPRTNILEDPKKYEMDQNQVINTTMQKLSEKRTQGEIVLNPQREIKNQVPKKRSKDKRAL